MKLYATSCSFAKFYTNLTKFMLNLNFYAFHFLCRLGGLVTPKPLKMATLTLAFIKL